MEANIIGLTVEQAKELYTPIRIVANDGINLCVDKKFMPTRRNVKVENGLIVSETSKG